MPRSDQQIIEAVTERIAKRRTKESDSARRLFTVSYAVSTATGTCYVGYNMDELRMTPDGSGHCAENRAAYVASTYNEKLEDLVFFALNDRSEFYNACHECQTWIWKARGFMKNQNGYWIISTAKPDTNSPPQWANYPLTGREQETLYEAGESVISEDSREYFGSVQF